MLSPVDEPSGAVLARQGEVAHSFLVVTTGEAAVLRDDGDGEHQVATVGPGAIVGELSVLRAAPRRPRLPRPVHSRATPATPARSRRCSTSPASRSGSRAP